MAQPRRVFDASLVQHERYEVSRAFKLKEKLDAGMSDEDAYELLASDGMLVKRPVLVGDDFAFEGCLSGFAGTCGPN